MAILDVPVMQASIHAHLRRGVYRSPIDAPRRRLTERNAEPAARYWTPGRARNDGTLCRSVSTGRTTGEGLELSA